MCVKQYNDNEAVYKTFDLNYS